MRLLFPYDTLSGDVDLTVTGATLDWKPLQPGLLQVDRRLVEILGVERQRWDSAVVQFEVTAPQTEIKDREGNGEKPRAYAVLEGGSTNMRAAPPLTVDPKNPARWTGSIEIERPFWYGRLSLAGSIVADVDGVPARVIGAAEPWVIALDDLPRPPVKGNIPVTWDSFKQPKELPELSKIPDEPFFLHLDAEGPVLYLNEDFPRLRPLLDDRARRPRNVQALHDQTRAAVAAQAWSAMFDVALAAASAVSDGEETNWPESEWQRSVLEILLARMYEERSPDDALKEAVEQFRQGEGTSALQELLLVAVSRQVGTARLLRSSISKLDGLEEDASNE